MKKKLSNSYNLKIINPVLAKEWHPTKNGDLTPDMITPGSNIRIWWLCIKGHEWQTRVFKRAKRGDGCGYCSNKKVNQDNCFATTHPDLAKKWHPTKNGKLTPNDFTYGSSKKAWWIDKYGHEWHSTISSQKNHGCPTCGNLLKGKIRSKTLTKRQIKLGNSFSNLYPELSKEWHPTKNGDLVPENITHGAKQKVWWKCPDCSFDWKCRINERTRLDRNPRYCPECTTIDVAKHKRLQAVKRTGSLSKLFPELSKEWHPTKNGDLTPDMISPNSEVKPWWLCKNNSSHEWQADLSNRTGNNTKCPYCSKKLPSKDYNFKLLHPDIAKEWNYELNDKLPEEYTPASKQKVWWNCKYAHPYTMTIEARTRKGMMQSCPAHKLERQLKTYNKTILEKVGSISEKYPELMKEWDWDKNKDLDPNSVTITSQRKVWWTCKRKHEWFASVNKRTIGNGNGHGQNCPKCNNKTSHLEIRIYSELKFFFPNTIWQHPFYRGHLDVFIPELNVAIEIDGFWHKDKETNDMKKEKRTNAEGIKLIRIRDKDLKQINRLHLTHDWRKEDDLQTLLNLFNLLLNEFELNISKKSELLDYINNKKYVNETFYLDTWANNTDPKPGHSLAERFPEIAKTWHPTANGNLTPNDISFGSRMKVYWLCSIHGKWKMSPGSRTHNSPPSGCKKCADKKNARNRMILAAKKLSVKDIPKLMEQWHPTKNSEFTPDIVSPNSNKNAWWKCKDGHVWSAGIGVIYRHMNEATKLDSFNGCPDCYNNNREKLADEVRKIKLKKSGSILDHYPKISNIWIKDNRWKPSDLSKGSNHRVKIKCPNNHVFETTPYRITKQLASKYRINCKTCHSRFTI